MIPVCLIISVFLAACGTSGEEKERMREIAETGEENAVNYIREKYGFEPEVLQTKACVIRDDTFGLQTTGSAEVRMSCEGEEFTVYISGEKNTLEGMDDYQYDRIAEEAEAYFSSLLGYEIYDLYLEYREEQIQDSLYSDDQEMNMISELYQAGDFENFMKRHPVYCRIDDCLGQDFTEFAAANPDAAAFLENAAEHDGMRAVLISYKSREDYESGYSHTYGRGGLMDFNIGQDGLYIQSYAVFASEGMEYNRFEVQEYDGILFCCADKKPEEDLLIGRSTDIWQELGETKKAPVSEIYTAGRKEPGEITVYIPAERFLEQWKGKSVFVQYFEDGSWRQYEPNILYTADEKYIFFTYHNFSGGDFDFAVFS